MPNGTDDTKPLGEVAGEVDRPAESSLTAPLFTDDEFRELVEEVSGAFDSVPEDEPSPSETDAVEEADADIPDKLDEDPESFTRALKRITESQVDSGAPITTKTAALGVAPSETTPDVELPEVDLGFTAAFQQITQVKTPSLAALEAAAAPDPLEGLESPVLDGEWRPPEEDEVEDYGTDDPLDETVEDMPPPKDDGESEEGEDLLDLVVALEESFDALSQATGPEPSGEDAPADEPEVSEEQGPDGDAVEAIDEVVEEPADEAKEEPSDEAREEPGDDVIEESDGEVSVAAAISSAAPSTSGSGYGLGTLILMLLVGIICGAVGTLLVTRSQTSDTIPHETATPVSDEGTPQEQPLVSTDVGPDLSERPAISSAPDGLQLTEPDKTAAEATAAVELAAVPVTDSRPSATDASTGTLVESEDAANADLPAAPEEVAAAEPEVISGEETDETVPPDDAEEGVVEESTISEPVVAAHAQSAARTTRLILVSTPENVRVYHGETFVGRTPLDQEVSFDTEIFEIELRKTHFEPLRVRLPSDQSAIGPIFLNLEEGGTDDAQRLDLGTLNRFDLDVTSVPSRARVYVNEVFIGRSPLEADIRTNVDDVELMVRKTAYLTFRMRLSTSDTAGPIEAVLEREQTAPRQIQP